VTWHHNCGPSPSELVEFIKKDPMVDDEELLGYLLHALDADEHRRVSEHVVSDGEALRRLELLRRILVPLKAYEGDFEAPTGLSACTCALVSREAVGRNDVAVHR
jgi:hypothetical protein